MCRIVPLLMVFICLMLLAGVLRATELGDLYAAEVPVLNSSSAQRNQGFAKALAKVMVRLSGDLSVNDHNGTAAVLQQAASLVQQFRYRLVQRKRHLWVKFDKTALNRLLRQAGIPVWGKQRPRVLLWLGVERAGQRDLMDLDNNPDNRNLLRGRAALRGLPLQFPLVDWQDQAQLNVADLWAGNKTAIQQASQRYPHDVVLTARMRHLSGNNWTATWTLFDADNVETFDVHGQQWSALLKQGIDGAQNRLAAKYAPTASAGEPEPLLVRFTHIDSLAAYGRLRQLLNTQEGLVRYIVQQVTGDALQVKLWLHGGRSALSRGFVLSGELLAVNDIANTNLDELVFSLSHSASDHGTTDHDVAN